MMGAITGPVHLEVVGPDDARQNRNVCPPISPPASKTGRGTGRVELQLARGCIMWCTFGSFVAFAPACRCVRQQSWASRGVRQAGAALDGRGHQIVSGLVVN